MRVEEIRPGVFKLEVTTHELSALLAGARMSLSLIEANPEKYVELGRFQPKGRSDQPAWPHPVLANGRLYIRDQDVLSCYDVKKP